MPACARAGGIFEQLLIARLLGAIVEKSWEQPDQQRPEAVNRTHRTSRDPGLSHRSIAYRSWIRIARPASSAELNGQWSVPIAPGFAGGAGGAGPILKSSMSPNKVVDGSLSSRRVRYAARCRYAGHVEHPNDVHVGNPTSFSALSEGHGWPDDCRAINHPPRRSTASGAGVRHRRASSSGDARLMAFWGAPEQAGPSAPPGNWRGKPRSAYTAARERSGDGHPRPGERRRGDKRNTMTGNRHRGRTVKLKWLNRTRFSDTARNLRPRRQEYRDGGQPAAFGVSSVGSVYPPRTCRSERLDPISLPCAVARRTSSR